MRTITFLLLVGLCTAKAQITNFGCTGFDSMASFQSPVASLVIPQDEIKFPDKQSNKYAANEFGSVIFKGAGGSLSCKDPATLYPSPQGFNCASIIAQAGDGWPVNAQFKVNGAGKASITILGPSLLVASHIKGLTNYTWIIRLDDNVVLTGTGELFDHEIPSNGRIDVEVRALKGDAGKTCIICIYR